MSQPHWMLDTRPTSSTAEGVGFRGFLYGTPRPDCADHIVREARLAPNVFLHNLNGCYCGFVRVEQRIIIFTDRYGYGKVYFSESPEGVVVGSSFSEVVRRLAWRTPDLVSIQEFLRFGYPLHDRTFLKEIRLLLPGTRLEIDCASGKLVREERWWQYKFAENLGKDREQMREQLWKTLESAVGDCFAEPRATYAVANSGGLDSRSILAIARSQGHRFVAYTLGSPGSDAIRIANEISRTLRLRQENIDIQTDFLPKYYETHLERRPMITLASAWYYSAIERLRECTINVNGMYGDNTLGIHLVHKYRTMNNDWDLYNYHSLADDNYLSQLTPLCFDKVSDHYKSTLATYRQTDRIKRFDQWNFENRQFRFIMEEALVDFLGDMQMRCPFMHNDLVDFAFTIPRKWRGDRRLYQEAISFHCPEIRHIRFERKAYSIRDPYWLRTAKTVRWHLAKRMEKLTGWNPFFHGAHKHQREWLLSEPNYSFVEDNFRRPSRLFSEFFHHEKIAANVHQLLETNWSVTSNLLTIKLWLERFIEEREY